MYHETNHATALSGYVSQTIKYAFVQYREELLDRNSVESNPYVPQNNRLHHTDMSSK